jgi:hypothetical protein
VPAGDIEEPRAGVDPQLLDHEVDRLDRRLLREAQGDQIEPVAFEPALVPVARDIHRLILAGRH